MHQHPQQLAATKTQPIASNTYDTRLATPYDLNDHAGSQAHLLQPPHMFRTPDQARNLNALSRRDSIQRNQLVARYVVNQGWGEADQVSSVSGKDETKSQQVQ